jgi:membrane-associated protease RseP (regulator of RpoE activity)
MPFVPFGTLGAVIRTRSVVPSRKAMFDIGVAGPLAGFVVALAYLIIGMATMPGIESLYRIHPEYRVLPALPDYGLHFGGFLLFDLLRYLLIAPGRFFPPMNEVYHYPFLAVGWFGMFVTALNMIPVGQLDGGHVVYGMFGRWQPRISRWFLRFIAFVGLGSVGLMLRDATRSYSTDKLYQLLQSIFGPVMEWIDVHASWWYMGWMGWLFWVVILRFLVRVKHPPSPDDTPLDRRRMVIGWIALAILVLTFSFTGIYELDSPEGFLPPPPKPPAASTPGVNVSVWVP